MYTNASVVVVINFEKGGAGDGGTMSCNDEPSPIPPFSSCNVAVGTDITVGEMNVTGTDSADGTYVVQGGLLNFNTGTNMITLEGSISGIVTTQTLLSGSFNEFSYTSTPLVGGGTVDTFTANGPDNKSVDLLNALGVDLDTPFSFFGFSLQQQSGVVTSTIISNTGAAIVPIPAALWLFASGIIGLVGFARRR
jgi:hypothetical protein